MPELTISSESVCHLIVKAREYDVQDVVTEPDPASNASDDRMASVLEAHPDDPTRREIVAFIRALNEEEQVDLVALFWLGRGDATIDEWQSLREQAREQHNDRTASYLLGEPLLSDHLQEGLSQFGQSCMEFEIDRL